jgi:phosphoribosyl-AMP cyclohydrolase
MTETTPTLPAALAREVRFDSRGLVPAIAQQHGTGEILMMAWMSAESLAETLETGQVCYWSRSRQALWRKGETSGHTQKLVELRVDCDGDTLLLLVEQSGPACHTGARNCFFRSWKEGALQERENE